MLILTSSNNFVTSHFIAHLPKPAQDMTLTFIPTAAEVEKGDLQWLKNDRQALVDVGFHVSDFTLTDKNKVAVQQMLETTDAVFVSGGNTFYLLQQMKKSGFAELIQSYVDKGLLYGGTSAGSIVAGPDITMSEMLDDTSLAPELDDYKGLGLVDVVVLPHWGSPIFKHHYEKIIEFSYRKGTKIILLTDDQYLVVDQGKYFIESI